MLALFTPTKLPPSHNTTPSNLNTCKRGKKHVDDVLMCFPSTLLHQSSVYLMKARMQSWGGFRWNSLHCSSSHCMHMASCSLKSLVLSLRSPQLLPCPGALMNLNAVQYLGCFSVVFEGFSCFLQQQSVSQLSVNNFVLLQTTEAWCDSVTMEAIVSATGNSQVDSTMQLPSSDPHCGFTSQKYIKYVEFLAERYILKSIIGLWARIDRFIDR